MQHTVYFVSGLPQPLRSGLDLPSVCAPDSATISYNLKKAENFHESDALQIRKCKEDTLQIENNENINLVIQAHSVENIPQVLSR
jgi:hypothetical protein